MEQYNNGYNFQLNNVTYNADEPNFPSHQPYGYYTATSEIPEQSMNSKDQMNIQETGNNHIRNLPLCQNQMDNQLNCSTQRALSPSQAKKMKHDVQKKIKLHGSRVEQANSKKTLNENSKPVNTGMLEFH